MIGPCVIPYGTGIDYMADIIRNAVGDEVKLKSSQHGAVVTRLLAFRSGVVKQLPDFKKIEKDCGVEIYQHIELGQQVNEYHTNLDGCGYIVAKATNIEEAIDKANRALENIRNTIFT